MQSGCLLGRGGEQAAAATANKEVLRMKEILTLLILLLKIVKRVLDLLN